MEDIPRKTHLEQQAEKVQKFIEQKGAVHPYEVREKFCSSERNSQVDFEPLKDIHSQGIYPLTYWGFSKFYASLLSSGKFAHVYLGNTVILCSKEEEKWRKLSMTGEYDVQDERMRKRLEEIIDFHRELPKVEKEEHSHVFPTDLHKNLFKQGIEELNKQLMLDYGYNGDNDE